MPSRATSFSLGSIISFFLSFFFDLYSGRCPVLPLSILFLSFAPSTVPVRLASSFFDDSPVSTYVTSFLSLAIALSFSFVLSLAQRPVREAVSLSGTSGYSSVRPSRRCCISRNRPRRLYCSLLAAVVAHDFSPSVTFFCSPPQLVLISQECSEEKQDFLRFTGFNLLSVLERISCVSWLN